MVIFKPDLRKGVISEKNLFCIQYNRIYPCISLAVYTLVEVLLYINMYKSNHI